MKKTQICMTIVLVLFMCSVAPAVVVENSELVVYWCGKGDMTIDPCYAWPDSVDKYWSNPLNWVTWPPPDYFVRLNFVPDLNDPVGLNRGHDRLHHEVTDSNLWTTVIDSNTAAKAAWVGIGYYGWHTLNITGGTLQLSGYRQKFYLQDANHPQDPNYVDTFMLELARTDLTTGGVLTHDSNSVLNISGGSVTGNGHFVVGGIDNRWGEHGANGHFNMSGGTVDCNGNLQIGMYHGTGDVNLSGGTFDANDLQMTSRGLLTISGTGKVMLKGDKRAIANAYIASGWIVGPAYVTYHVDTNKTEISTSSCGSGADLSGDCYIDVEDVEILADNWLAVGTNQADISGDGRVNFKDFAMLASRWLQVP